jgi:hypothetical protein
MFTPYSFGINPTEIAQYLDYALYGIFGMVALGFVFGFIRGVWREGFRLLFVGGLVVLSVLFTRQLVDLFMDLDVSSLAASAGFASITLNLNDTPIIVSVTTPYDTIYNLLEQSLLAFGFFITQAIADLIIGLTLVILRYLLFIVLAIIIFLLGESLAAILYFLPFRFFIPWHFRKKVKMRLLGGVAGALKMVLVLTMFLSPFTSLINSVTTSFKDFDEQYGDQIDAELYDEIMSFVDVYNDSTFAQTLFSWSLTDNGLSIDSALMDFVSGQDLDSYRLTLANELGSVVDIAATLIGSGAIDSTFTTIDTSLLLTEDLVTNLITSLTGSVLIMKILPIAVTIGLNLDEVSNYLDPSLIDLDDLVWEDELEYLGDIFKGVIRSGILSPILSGNTDTAFLIDTIFSPTVQPEVNQILETIDESPFLSQVIPAVLFKLVEDEIAAGGPEGGVGLSTFLPTNWADYQAIQFGSELSLIYELVYELNSEVDGLFDVILPMNDSALPLGRRQVDEPEAPSIVDLLSEHFDLFVEVLLGEVDNTGLPINNNPTSGKGINRRSLLDSDLIMNGVPSIVENLLLPPLTSVAGETFDDTDLNALIAEFNEGALGEVRLSYKGEFAGILSILDAVINNETLIDLLEPEPDESLNILALLEDAEFRKGLKTDLIPTLDRSDIILNVVPGILESTLTGGELDDFLDLLSLTSDDLNFEFTSLSRELIIIIDMLGYAFNVIDASSDLLNQFPTIAFDLIGLLDNIYLSDVINKNPITNNKTTNYNQLIKGIFSLVDSIGIDEADIEVGFNRVVPVGLENGWTTTFVDTNNNDKLDALDTVSYAGENYQLVNFLKTAIDSGLLDISGDIFDALDDLTTGSEDIDDPNVAVLYKTFAYADRSEIISASFGGILDNLFGSTGGLLDTDLGTSFRNVTSWTEEGSNLIFLVKQLTNFTDGLDNIDFLNSDASMVEELLQGLAASEIFVKPNGDYVFPDFLLDQLTGITDLTDYFVDPSPYQSTWDDDPTNNFTIVTEDFYAISNQASTRTNWYGVKSMITNVDGDPILDLNGDIQYEFVGGELENIVGFIAELQEVPIADLTSGTGLSGESISDVLLALNNAPSLRVLVYNVYDSIFGGSSFDIGSISLSESNTFVFLDLDQTGRAQQIQATADLIETISDMGLDDGGAFDIAGFDETTILNVGDLLTILHDASLFNSFKLGRSRAQGDLTVFENVYEFLLTTATLDTFIYDGFNEVQTEAALYQDITALDNNFGSNTPDDWVGVDGEIQRFVDIMVAFVNTGIDFSDFSGAGSSDVLSDLTNTDVGIASVENLLFAMNSSSIVYPAIPSLFSNMLNAASISGLDVDFSLANTRYRGNRNDPNNPQIGDQYLPYQESEISNILAIFTNVKEVGTKEYSNLNLLTNDDIDEMQFLLEDLHDSNVFHLEGPSTGLITDLTVFEQMVVMMMNQTSVSQLIYDTNNPNPIYIGEFSTEEEKAEFLVLNFSTLFPINNLTHFTSSWLNTSTESGELTRFFTIFKELKANLEGVGNFDGIDVSSLSPNSISRIMSALNYSSLASDAVPDLVRDALGFISFSTYTEDNENYYLTPKEYVLTDLNQMNYEGETPSIVQTGVIAQTLNNFYDDGTNAYLTLGANFNMEDYLDEGNSSFVILDLLARSNVLGNLATFINDPSNLALGLQPTSLTFKTRALTFFNLLDDSGVTKYFNYLNTTEDEKEKKVDRIEDIFAVDFDTAFEATRLDQFITTISGFTDDSDASNLDQFSAEMRSLIELTYTATGDTIIDRAFMVSELSAGFFTDIFKNEYALVEDVEAPYAGDANNPLKQLNFYDANFDLTNDFLLLNPIEADGIEGALEFLSAIKGVSGTPTPSDVSAMVAALIKMGSRANLLVPGGPHPDATDFTTWSNAKISQIGQLFYGARIVTNTGFDGLSALIVTVTTPNPFTNPSGIQTILSQQPYEDNFVFEIEAEKISYAFTTA